MFRRISGRSHPGSGKASPFSPALTRSLQDEDQKRDDQGMYERVRRTVCDLVRTPEYAPPTAPIDIVCGTWNVAEEGPVVDFAQWLRMDKRRQWKRRPHLIAVTLQEVDMSVSTLVAEHSDRGNLWCERIHEQIGGEREYVALSPTQVVGLMLIVFVRADVAGLVRHVAVNVVRLGKGGRLGNKAGIGLSLRYGGRAICFIAVHLAQNIEGWQKRNDSYHTLMKEMSFTVEHTADAYFSLRTAACLDKDLAASAKQQKKLTVLEDHDYVVFCGDVNYRLHDVEEDDCLREIARKNYAGLLECDQLNISIADRAAFADFYEAPINFPPTYKLHRHANTYEASHEDGKGKKRVPAWTDRVLVWTRPVNGNRASIASYSSYDVKLSDHRPVSAWLQLHVWDISRPDAAALFERVNHAADSLEKVAWTRRWFTRYLTSPAYETLVDSSFAMSGGFQMHYPAGGRQNVAAFGPLSTACSASTPRGTLRGPGSPSMASTLSSPTAASPTRRVQFAKR